jgi:hypothetical protein
VIIVHRGNRACGKRLALLVPRRGTACLGVFAILFQAILFGWHSHPLPVSAQGVPTALSAPAGAGDEDPSLADDDCQICFALSHHSAAPIDFIPPLPLGEASTPAPRVEESLAPKTPYLNFRSRAPPRA